MSPLPFRNFPAGTPLLFLSLAAILPLCAQTFQMGAVYQCGGGQSFKVISCAGAGAADLCDVQSYNNGAPNLRGKSTRQQVLTLVPLCHPQTAAEAGAKPAAAAASAVGAGGFKVGDTVQINTAFGWMNAKVLQVNGNSYFVHAQSGADVWKPYPSELRRIGSLNAEDRANGLYSLHDHVQVNVEGRWEDGEIITEMGQEYQVQLSGNRAAWAKGPNLRLRAAAATAKADTGPKAGQPPKPGLTSCAGKIEGRYTATNGLPNKIEFRSGKATLTAPLMGNEELECWTAGGKIYLHKPGEADDLVIEINNDGTLDTPMGELKKKGN